MRLEWSDRRACNDGNGEAVACGATTTESLCGNNVGTEMDLFVNNVSTRRSREIMTDRSRT